MILAAPGRFRNARLNADENAEVRKVKIHRAQIEAGRQG
jgi:hypothetical protein